MKSALLVLAIAGYILAIVAPAYAGCPPGTTYRCYQGAYGKVVCGCALSTRR